MPMISFYVNASDYDNYLALTKDILKDKTQPAKFLFLKAQNEQIQKLMKGKGFEVVCRFRVIDDE